MIRSYLEGDQGVDYVELLGLWMESSFERVEWRLDLFSKADYGKPRKFQIDDEYRFDSRW